MSVTIQEVEKDLRPLKVIIHGPPASGKTTVARRLVERYGAHYVNVKTMIEETLQELRENIDREKEKMVRAKAEKEKVGEGDVVQFLTDDENDDSDNEDDDVGDIEMWQEQIRDINTLLAKSPDRRLPDQYVARMLRDFLNGDTCRTRGYVLDGYPKTIEQCREIFGHASEEGLVGEGGVIPAMEGEGGPLGGEDADVGDVGPTYTITPDYVVSLIADDQLLCERVMRLPQREIQGTHYEEASMLRRLNEFRAANTENNTMLRFFDEMGVHPILIHVFDEELNQLLDIDCIYNYLCDVFGEPIPGFGLSDEEIERLRRLEAEQRRLREEEDRIEKQMLEERARKEYQDKMEKWVETLEKLQMEEEKILVTQSEPLRFYLMKYVFPVLSKGLVEVAKVRPDDPLDYLAEYLFRENPEGRMFDPSYTREGESILDQYDTQVAPLLKHSREELMEKLRSSN